MALTLRQIFPPLLIGMHLLAAAPALFAQASFTGTLLGTVTDSSGAVLPGAEVVAINLATNERQTTQTDSAGNFLVPTLKPGTYRLEVGMDGFKRLLRDGI